MSDTISSLPNVFEKSGGPSVINHYRFSQLTKNLITMKKIYGSICYES